MNRALMVIGLFAFSLSSWANPEPQSVEKRLKHCVLEVLPEVRASDSPSPEAVLERCQAEFDAVMLSLPIKTATIIDKAIRRDIAAELARSSR